MSLHAPDQGFPNSIDRWGEIPSHPTLSPTDAPTLPQLKVMGIAKGFNLYGVGDLRRSNFDHLNFFQSQKQHSVNIEHRLKSKLTWPGWGTPPIPPVRKLCQHVWSLINFKWARKSHPHHNMTSLFIPMWSRVEKGPPRLFIPNHFVPLLRQ